MRRETAVALILALALASPALAQPAASGADPEAEEPGVETAPSSRTRRFSEEVVVTATRREQPIENVPVSVLAVRGEQLMRERIQTLEELSLYTPNLLVGNGALTTTVTIRGMGSQPERGFEQSAGLFVDGIYMPRSRQYRPAFLDVSRVEVLRGPQAILFGLNATAGAVSILTNRTHPKDPAFAELRAEYELEHGGPQLTAVAGASPADWIGLRVAGRIREDGDFYRNDFDDTLEGGTRDDTIRVSASLRPSESSWIEAKYEHGRFAFDGDFGEQFGPEHLNQLLLFGLPGADDGHLDWRRTMDRDFYPAVTQPFGGRTSPGLSQRNDELAIKAGLDVGTGHLDAVFGHSRLGWDSYADTDASALPIFVSGINETYRQTSGELTWTSPAGRTVDFLLGAYAHSGDLANHQPNMFDPTLATAPGAFGFDQVFSDASFETTSSLWSLFGTATWRIASAFRLTGGIRYVDEAKDHHRSATCVPVRGGVVDLNPGPEDRELFERYASEFFCGTLDGIVADRHVHNVMPELAFEWRPRDAVMAYAKYGTSAKSGGFAAALVLEPGHLRYEDESARSFELGLRSRLGGGRGRLNLAAFRTDFDDLQLNAFDPVTGSGFVTNAAGARSQGLELDGGWLISPSVWLSGAVAFLDAKYTSFPTAPCPIGVTLGGGEPPCDATGQRLPRAPEITASLGLSLDRSLGAGPRVLGGVRLGYTSDYAVDAALEPALSQDSFVSFSARLGLAAGDDRWGVALVGTNLTNEAVLSDALPFFSNIGYLKPPRRLTLQARYRIGSR